jgi:hypothetical protein
MEWKGGGAGKVLLAACGGSAGQEAATRVVRGGGGGELTNPSSGQRQIAEENKFLSHASNASEAQLFHAVAIACKYHKK